MLLNEPLVKDIHYGVVHNVERVGNVAQELVYTPCHVVAATAAGTHPHYHGEEQCNAGKLIEAVDACLAGGGDVWNRKYCNEQYAA